MAGIYIHVPFCRKACHYCNFHFSTSLNLKEELVEALLKEIQLNAAYLEDEIIETVYFGGGTPSLLNNQELNNILHKLRQQFKIDANAEVTFEANPDDINSEKLKEWKGAGINRLSIGVQSFFDEHLRWMNRIHSTSQSIQAIELANLEGLSNISIDLIYGVPGMTNIQWLSNLEQARQLQVAHLSSYALTVEPSTALYKMIRQQKTSDVDEELQSEQFAMLAGWAATAGYEHYEISNLAQPGKRSRHNSSYWQGKKYLGLGPSAHSFNGRSRQWNVANNALYIKTINENILPVEIETLTPAQQFNEYVMTSLRTAEGINLEVVERRFGEAMLSHIQKAAGSFINIGRAKYVERSLVLTPEGRFFADGIAAELFR